MSRLWRTLSVSVILAVALAGCANNYKRFYTDVSRGLGQPIAPTSGDPEIVPTTGNATLDIQQMYEAGYGLIGYSTFRIVGGGSAEQAIAHAKDVNATKLVLYSQAVGTNTAHLPITTNVPVSTQSSGVLSLLNPRGTTTGTYLGNSTTYLPMTNFIPITTTTTEESALYFGKLPSDPCFGALLLKPTVEELQNLGTNRALKVFAIRRDSPAYFADVLPGDFLLSASPSQDPAGDSASKTQFVEVYRSGKKLKIPVATTC